MKNIILLILFLGCFSAYSQSPTVGIIRSGDTYTNDHDSKVYYMPESKVMKYLDLQTKVEIDSARISKYQELITNYEERIFLADSSTALKRIEADIWYRKLQENDSALEIQRVENIRLKDDNNRIRKSRIYYFVAGILSSSIFIMATK